LLCLDGCGLADARNYLARKAGATSGTLDGAEAKEENMLTTHTTRRGFAARLAALFPSLRVGRFTSATPPPGEQEQGGVQKLDAHGKPSDRKGFITPLIIHNGVIYIAGQGAHSQGDKSDEGKTPTIELHTKMVMEGVKNVVEAGGGTMDSILQLTVYLAKLEYYDGMNSVFKTYFPNGGPARTTVAVAGLPGESLVEINCIAAVVRDAKKGA
jgi:enamine deaminase RidA (YjgF/YER057c/UK114 family)